MRDEEKHLVGLLPDVEQQLLNGLAREGVERGHRLVHQQHRRIAGQRAGDAHALLHAARQLIDHVLVEVLQADEREIAHGDLMPLRLRHALQLQAEFGVVDHVEPRQQRVLLEHDAAIRARSRDRFAAEQQLAAASAR